MSKAIRKTIRTTYGPIFEPVGSCQDDYRNIRTDSWDGQNVTLQEAALRSFHAAEDRYGARTNRKGARQIGLTGSHRTCAQQAALYKKDPHRFAPPDASLHPRGLAVDVSQAQPNLAMIRTILKAHGWKQARPTDEPWHYSYWVSG